MDSNRTKCSSDRDDKKAEKRKLILDSAYELFLEERYASAKIADIAARAGIGKGTVYEYFSSKEEILLEIINSKIIPEYDFFPEMLKEKNDVRSRLSAFLTFKRNFLERYGRYVNEIHPLFHEENTEMACKICDAIKQIIGCEYSVMLKILEDGIASGELRPINPILAAHLIVGTAASFASANSGMLQSMQECGFPIDTRVAAAFTSCTEEDFFELIFNGISAK